VSEGTVIVEFFGVPRWKAGRSELSVAPGTVAEVLAAVRARCPGLADLLTGEGRLAAHYLLSVDGVNFVRDLAQRLPARARLLLLSADAGG
jgi:hypothetical protein